MIVRSVLAVTMLAGITAAAEADTADHGPIVRNGMTFDVAPGVGFARTRAEGDDAELSAAFGLSVGLGTWIDEHDAFQVRVAAGAFDRSADARVAGIFAGPAVQHWFRERAFAGGGFGVLALGDLDEFETSAGFDLRGGYVLTYAGSNAIVASAEATVGLTETGPAAHVALQLGLQR